MRAIRNSAPGPSRARRHLRAEASACKPIGKREFVAVRPSGLT